MGALEKMTEAELTEFETAILATKLTPKNPSADPIQTAYVSEVETAILNHYRELFRLARLGLQHDADKLTEPSKPRCETCGSPVTVEGNTTKYYVNAYDALKAEKSAWNMERLTLIADKYELKLEADKLAESLKHYASEKNWRSTHGNGGGVDDTIRDDCAKGWVAGSRAREALTNWQRYLEGSK